MYLCKNRCLDTFVVPLFYNGYLPFVKQCGRERVPTSKRLRHDVCLSLEKRGVYPHPIGSTDTLALITSLSFPT